MLDWLFGRIADLAEFQQAIHESAAEPPHAGESSAELDRLILEQAEKRYAEVAAALERLDRKIEEFLRFAAALLVALVALTQGGQTTALTVLAALALVNAVVFLVLARSSQRILGRAEIESMRQCVQSAEQPGWFLAGTLHRSTKYLELLGDRRALLLNLAVALLAAALALQAIALIATWGWIAHA